MEDYKGGLSSLSQLALSNIRIHKDISFFAIPAVEIALRFSENPT